MAGLEHELHTTREQQSSAQSDAATAQAELERLEQRLGAAESGKAEAVTLVNEVIPQTYACPLAQKFCPLAKLQLLSLLLRAGSQNSAKRSFAPGSHTSGRNAQCQVYITLHILDMLLKKLTIETLLAIIGTAA